MLKVIAMESLDYTPDTDTLFNTPREQIDAFCGALQAISFFNSPDLKSALQTPDELVRRQARIEVLAAASFPHAGLAISYPESGTKISVSLEDSGALVGFMLGVDTEQPHFSLNAQAENLTWLLYKNACRAIACEEPDASVYELLASTQGLLEGLSYLGISDCQTTKRLADLKNAQEGNYVFEHALAEELGLLSDPGAEDSAKLRLNGTDYEALSDNWGWVTSLLQRCELGQSGTTVYEQLKQSAVEHADYVIHTWRNCKDDFGLIFGESVQHKIDLVIMEIETNILDYYKQH